MKKLLFLWLPLGNALLVTTLISMQRDLKEEKGWESIESDTEIICNSVISPNLDLIKHPIIIKGECTLDHGVILADCGSIKIASHARLVFANNVSISGISTAKFEFEDDTSCVTISDNATATFDLAEDCFFEQGIIQLKEGANINFFSSLANTERRGLMVGFGPEFHLLLSADTSLQALEGIDRIETQSNGNFGKGFFRWLLHKQVMLIRCPDVQCYAKLNHNPKQVDLGKQKWAIELYTKLTAEQQGQD